MVLIEQHLLSLMLAVPVVGVLVMLFIKHEDKEIENRNIRAVAMLTTLVAFVLSILLWALFDNSQAGFQFVDSAEWYGPFNYRVGVDGISMLFVVLSAFLMPFVIGCSLKVINTRVKEYMIAFLLLEALMFGVFIALDIFTFYIFFEAGLIPMFLIIGVWGGVNRIYASYKFFLYTLLGSVLMLVAVMYMYLQTGTTDIPTLMSYNFDADIQKWLWLAFFASFAVKMPMWPVHTWLPDAHVQAPTAGSVILAGVLLKMGGYGFLRFSLPMFPDASVYFADFVFWLSVIAVIYTSLVALVQEDIKKLIAYSSVAHMGFVTIGIFVFNNAGIVGSIFQMLSHGIVSGALFLCVGVIYDRLHTREIVRYQGLANNMKLFAVLMVFFSMASIGLPGTSGFVGEFMVLLGAYQYSSWLAFGAATGVILGAGYMLYLVLRVVFGELVHEDNKKMIDLTTREKVIFAPLVAVVLWMGVYPSSFTEPMQASVNNLIETRLTPAIEAAKAQTKSDKKAAATAAK
ncbi:NADH-quinone oxidoreductase subunit M [Temperatibacter marinus]|uniref:NADH-quinone oxidoreductase subunit M n=1 Tax=Temperatibacter marinus TaxID=1456591 RepID=A0AA52EH38_9PROT|nr:NADH-quinone oxidoreductase subunit M [Temperatibacter marinus]WND02404.1 NADH-quinone oxidoreductase subunit M [Temperatibacter marinus]